MSRIHHLKKLDSWAGTILSGLLPRPRMPLPMVSPGAVLVIRPGGIGDAVHLAPALQALRQDFPSVVIDILAERRNAGVFALCPGIRNIYLYDQPRQLLGMLRNGYDIVIDTEQWHRLSAVVARMVKAPVKIGFATNERARLLTHGIAYSHDDYEAISFLRLLGPIGIADAAVPSGPWLQVSALARQSVVTLLPADDCRPLVVLFPGASIAERRWGTANFRAVAQWCVGRGGRVVVVGGGGEREAGEAITQGLGRALSLAGHTSLAETAAVLEAAAVVVSGDSGILHIAVGLGRPTVSLFGSGIAAKWAPRGERHVVLNRHLPCSPCTRFGTTPPCPHDNRCLREISPDDVTTAIARLLNDPEQVM